MRAPQRPVKVGGVFAQSVTLSHSKYEQEPATSTKAGQEVPGRQKRLRGHRSGRETSEGYCRRDRKSNVSFSAVVLLLVEGTGADLSPR